MENDKHWVFECNIEIKSEPDEHTDELNETDTFCEIGTEPSTSDAVHRDLNSLPYYSYNNKIEEELEIPPEQDYDESDKICSESDQVALNSNIDYQKLLEGIYILETQRAQAIADLDELYELQEQALSDPNAFLEKLHNVNFSASSKIDELPVTDWSKYELNFNASRIRSQQTKLAAKISDFIKLVGEQRNDEDNPVGQVRKQRYKSWTPEEQKRLEELLRQFPPEESGSQRFKKIANCLEDRTAGQVAGRVRSYFRALKKHGISVIGEMPPTDYIKKPCSCIIGPNPSTLLVSHQPPIYKPDGSEEKSNIILQERRKLIRHNYIKYWTDEEQKKLDDLLVQFPPEENETSRWEKISKYFPNRTPRQVATRVHYLKMLMQNGKFVPGKIPGIQFNENAYKQMYPRYSHGSNIMQYWTPEEQRRLEELLILFPPEKFEYRRWEKIAKCLGNRTAAQVGARAKCYFVRLKRYGMPVPGKVPRNFHRSKSSRKRKCEVISDCSTIWDSPYCTTPSTVENSIESKKDGSGEKDIKPELELMEKSWKEEENSSGSDIVYIGEKDINPELELMKEAWKEKQNSSGLAHIGYKCSRCKVEPIMGVRWHCTVCITQSVDFCSDCCTSEYKELKEHKFDHPLAAIQGVTH